MFSRFSPFSLLFLAVLGVLPLSSVYASDQELQELRRQISDLQSILSKQSARLSELESKSSMEKVELKETTSAKGTVTRGSSLPRINPDIGIVADMTGIFTESDEDGEGNDKFSVREVELVFGQDVDPYTRLDATVTLSDFEDVKLEEAYATYTGLPYDITTTLGRFKPKIGKAIAVHRDQLETVDEPFVVQEYFGVEGWSKSGVELGYYIPTGIDWYAPELRLGVIEGGNGENGTTFGDTRRRPTFYGRLRNFFDINDTNNFELGASYLRGVSTDTSNYDVNVYGLDATFVHYVTPSNPLKLQSEFYFQDRRNPSTATLHSHDEEEDHGHSEGEEHEEEGDDHDGDSDHDESHHEFDELMELTDFNTSPYGFYSLIDYRLSQNWGVGGRFDLVQPINVEEDYARSRILGYSAFLTYYQSEFARYRLQYQKAKLLDGLDDDRFMLQATFAIGVHKHNIQ